LRSATISQAVGVQRFDNADLYGASLAGLDLSGASFDGAILENADLSGTNLEFSSFVGARFQATDLRGSNLNVIGGLTDEALAETCLDPHATITLLQGDGEKVVIDAASINHLPPDQCRLWHEVARTAEGYVNTLYSTECPGTC
jgi:hypothetical protein